MDQRVEGSGKTGAGRHGFVLLVIGAAVVAGLAVLAWTRFSTDRIDGRTEDVVRPETGSVRLPGGAAALEADPRPQQTEPLVTGADRSAAEPAPIAAVPASDAVMAAVARFKDARVPIEERQSELESLTKRTDRQAVEILQALGDERTYLGWMAVEKLGGIEHQESREDRVRYLEAKLKAPDPRLLCAAVRALARLQGDRAVPALAEVIRRNRVRPDGQEGMVCAAAVKALSGIISAEAVPILREELERSGDKGWDLEYGSSLVAALADIENREARAAAAAYAERLAGQVPDDPMARDYYQKKIAEAREAAGPAGAN